MIQPILPSCDFISESEADRFVSPTPNLSEPCNTLSRPRKIIFLATKANFAKSMYSIILLLISLHTEMAMANTAKSLELTKGKSTNFAEVIITYLGVSANNFAIQGRKYTNHKLTIRAEWQGQRKEFTFTEGFPNGRPYRQFKIKSGRRQYQSFTYTSWSDTAIFLNHETLVQGAEFDYEVVFALNTPQEYPHIDVELIDVSYETVSYSPEQLQTAVSANLATMKETYKKAGVPLPENAEAGIWEFYRNVKDYNFTFAISGGDIKKDIKLKTSQPARSLTIGETNYHFELGRQQKYGENVEHPEVGVIIRANHIHLP